MRLILLGPPGGGKGTQAKLLCQRIHLEHISTGDLLRAAAAAETPLGLLAKPYMDAGQLAPDDIVNDLVAERIRREDRPERFVLDGYPRTLSQAAALDAVLREQFLDLSAVVLLSVDDNEIVRRLSGRGRADDRPETVRARLAVYHNDTVELIPHYQAQGLLREVSGAGDIETVYNNIDKVLNPKAGPPC
jgi:adenylate kinase